MASLAEGPATSLRLPSGRLVQVQTYGCRFKPWTVDPTRAPLYFKSGKNPKPVVDLNGEPLFPELAVLRLLERQGWHGVWMDTYSRRVLQTWSDPPVSVRLETEQEAILASISERRGCWDIFAWRDGRVLFADTKWKGKDRSTGPQLRWLEAALDSGFDLSCFRLVEWSFDVGVTGRARGGR